MTPRAGVYFAKVQRDGGAIKIGHTTALANRLSQLKSDNPDPIELIGFWDGASVRDERALHDQFQHLRIQGEWFRDEPELRAFVANHPDVSRGAHALYVMPRQTPGKRKQLVGLVLGADDGTVYRVDNGWVRYMAIDEGTVYVRDNLSPTEATYEVLAELREMKARVA